MANATKQQATRHNKASAMTSNPPEELVLPENKTKLKLLEARFGADGENSNSQTSFDSPSLRYQQIPSWQRMQQQQPPKSALKSSRKQAVPRKSVVIVQESPPKAKADSNQGGSNSGTTVTSSNRRKRKAVAPIKRTNEVSTAKKPEKTSPRQHNPKTPTNTTATKILDFFASNKKRTPSLTSIALQKTAAHSHTLDWQAKHNEIAAELADAKSQLKAIHNNRSVLQHSLESSLKESRREIRNLQESHESVLSKYKQELIRLATERATRNLQDFKASVTGNDSELQLQRLEKERQKLQRRKEELQRPIANDTTGSSNHRLLHAERISTRERALRQLERDQESWNERYEIYKTNLQQLNRQRKLLQATTCSRFGIQTLHDRYVLCAIIGKGGFSEVWQAYDVVSCDTVAVKIHQLDRRWSESKKASYTKHVSREYDIHRSVSHDRIVRLLDVFEIDSDSFATVLEFCQGTDLDAILKEQTKLPEADAKSILLQVLTAMEYLSSSDDSRQAIIHYDLKPANILLDEDGNVKITDFGLSKIIDADSMELTSQGAGTYWYLPPECFLEDARISNKVDVWSIGVIYYQMLVGKRPFGHGQTQDAILADGTILNARVVHFPEDESLSTECQNFIRACLMYDQVLRPTIAELCEHPYIAGSSE